jgi:hypothetical protein
MKTLPGRLTLTRFLMMDLTMSLLTMILKNNDVSTIATEPTIDDYDDATVTVPSDAAELKVDDYNYDSAANSDAENEVDVYSNHLNILDAEATIDNCDDTNVAATEHEVDGYYHEDYAATSDAENVVDD